MERFLDRDFNSEGFNEAVKPDELEAIMYSGFSHGDEWTERGVVNRLQAILPRKELFMKIVATDDSDIQRLEGREPMFRAGARGREALARVGGFLGDLAVISDRVILPGPGPEMVVLASRAYMAALKGEVMKLYTPICPDWSRDAKGQFDFKSLGSEASFIGQKFIAEVPALLRLLAKHQIAYEGVLVFADWGLETEITARGSYGEELAADEVVERFAESFRATEAMLTGVEREKAELFENYKVMSMTEFLATELGDAVKVCKGFQERFLQGGRPEKLLRLYHQESLAINERRLGVSEEENLEMSLATLSEYATLGMAIKKGVMVAAESRIASLAYNVFRSKRDRLPLVFLKGRKSLSQGVNIL